MEAGTNFASVREQFDRDGFLVVPNALDQSAVDRLVATADGRMGSGLQFNRTTRSNWDGVRNCIELDDAFRSLLMCPTTFPIVAQLLGPNIHLISSQLIYLASIPPDAPRAVRTPEKHGWHRDLYGTVSDLGHAKVPRLAIKVAYYLTDLSTPDAGVTVFAPGSHLLQRPLEIPEGEIDPAVVCRLELHPGDAVLFENRTWHAGGINHSGVTRKCTMYQYGFRWIKPVDYVMQKDSLLANCSSIERQLLGAENDRDEEGRLVLGKGATPLRAWFEENNFTYYPSTI